MGDRNLELEYWKERLTSLEKDCQTLRAEIGATGDPLARQTLEKRLTLVFQDIDRVSEKVTAIRQLAQNQAVDARDTALLAILQAHGEKTEIRQAYQTTIAHWSADIDTTATTPQQILKELKRISPNPNYSAQEEFIAHLRFLANSDRLLNALNIWGQQHYPERNWDDLREQIRQTFEAALKQAQPAIFVQMNKAEEATTQSDDNTPHYQLKAWLIEDIEKYQQHRQGYHQLMEPDTPAAEPFVLHRLETKIQPLLNQWLSHPVLANCDQNPEFYVFLPKDQLDLNPDYWPLDERGRRRLGQIYSVVLCCTDRLEGPYPKGTWRKLWNRHQDCHDQIACDLFIDGSDRDIDALIDQLEATATADNAVGLKVTTAPCAPNADELFEELLVSGLPVAIWGRCDETQTTISLTGELDKLLRAANLCELPQRVHSLRRGARITTNTPDCYIGHHLSLLRDNPTLIPPKSA